MSERSSFVTEYVYCRKCFAALRTALLVADSKHLVARRIGDLRIIAGKLGDSAPHLEWRALMDAFSEAKRADKPMPCHPVRVAVVEDSGGGVKVYTVHPDGLELDPDCILGWNMMR